MSTGTAIAPQFGTLDLVLREERKYLHSASICNELHKLFGHHGRRFSITFKEWMSSKFIFAPYGELDVASKGEFILTPSNGDTVQFSFGEDLNFPVNAQEGYDEVAIVSQSKFSNKIAESFQIDEVSFFDRLIAVNKELITRELNPGVKLIASKISLNDFHTKLDAQDFELRLQSNVGTKIFKSDFTFNGQKNGEVIFYGQ